MQSSKNIININPSKNKDKSPINIVDKGDTLIITAQKDFLLKSSTYDIHNLLMLCLSPLFLNKDKQIDDKVSIKADYKPIKKAFPHIAFFIENKNHYTGGRYSLYHQAVLLSQYTKVTVVTNQKPLFYNDFKDYYNERFKLIVSGNYLSGHHSNSFDVVVGIPVISGEYATHYSEKWNLPLYLVVFESPNWVSKFRDGDDAYEDFWSSYKKCLMVADKILVPSYESQKHVKEWIAPESKHIDVIYPCINEIVASKIKPPEQKNKKKNIVVSTRMVSFKSSLSIIKKLGSNYKYHLIGKVKSDLRKEIDKLNYDVIYYESVNDKKKFEIISKADVLIHPSLFEGFGMPPMEAIYYNKPVVAYYLPVLHEIYGNAINYAKWGEVGDFVEKVKETLVNSAANESAPNLKVMKQLEIKHCLGKLLDSFNIPKLTAGMIVYNGSEYMKYAINSIKHMLYQIIIVEGAVQGYSSKANSSDETISIAQDIRNENICFREVDYYCKSNGKFWKDKIEMQNKIAGNVRGNFYLKLDSDEIWNPETLMKAMNLFIDDNELGLIKMPFIHFWLSFDNVAKDAGGKWGTKHPRLWRWESGYRHSNSFNYFQDTSKDFRKVQSPYVKTIEFKGDIDDVIFHLGYVRKLKYLKEKINYYKKRGIETFVKDTVTNWTDGKSTQPTQKVKSWSEKFTGTLPVVLDCHPYKKIKDIRDV
jgi:glycosyltransferase involved in cell wall biosynthesis